MLVWMKKGMQDVDMHICRAKYMTHELWIGWEENYYVTMFIIPKRQIMMIDYKVL